MGSDNKLSVINTKDKIKQAFIQLIKNKGVHPINITNIAKMAKINRGTFYLHYKNIDDLTNEYYQEFMHKLYRSFEDNIGEFYYFKDGRNPELIPLHLVCFFEIIKHNHELFSYLSFKEKNNAFYKEYLREFVKHIFLENKYAFMDKKELDVPEAYFIAYVHAATSGIIECWLENNCKEPIEEIAWILASLNVNGVTPLDKLKI